MKVHTLDRDSSERNTTVYPYANRYVFSLNDPVYDVTQIKLVSARIPTPQLTTCATNKTFSLYDSGAPDELIEVTLDETNYTDGGVLASDLDTKMQPPLTCVDSVVFDSDTQALTFSNTVGSNTFTFKFSDGTHGYSSNVALTTPHQVMGFSSQNPTAGTTIVSGAINLEGPNSLILRMTSGSDEFTKVVYGKSPFFTGHILMNGSDTINYHGADDPFIHNFHASPQKFIRDLKIEFFYMSHGRLIPYDFRGQDHILKFEITCSTDKLEVLPKVPIDVVKDEPEPESQINIPTVLKDVYKWKIEYVSIGIIILVGIVMLSLMRKSPKLSE